MKYLALFIIIFCAACQPVATENQANISNKKKITKSTISTVDTSIFETFSYEEGDTTYLMKKYFMVHLKKGTNRDQSKEVQARIQEAHLAHLDNLAEDKKICIAGPFEGDTEFLGLAIYSVPNLEIADSLAKADPAVQAGRLEVEVIPFWAAVGSQLF